MGKLGEYSEEEFRILQAEPPQPPGGDGEGGEDPPDDKPVPENLTDDDIDDIIEKAKENGFDGIDNEGVVDEDDDLTPEPDEDEDEEEGGDEEGGDEEKGGEDGEDEEKGGEDGEDEEKGGEDGQDEEKGGEDGEEKGGDDGTFNPEFEDITEETEEDKERRLKVRYAQLLKKIQNGQKSMSDIASKYGDKIPTRIVGQMKQSAKQLQDLKETNIYDD